MVEQLSLRLFLISMVFGVVFGYPVPATDTTPAPTDDKQKVRVNVGASFVLGCDSVAMKTKGKMSWVRQSRNSTVPLFHDTIKLLKSQRYHLENVSNLSINNASLEDAATFKCYNHRHPEIAVWYDVDVLNSNLEEAVTEDHGLQIIETTPRVKVEEFEMDLNGTDVADDQEDAERNETSDETDEEFDGDLEMVTGNVTYSDENGETDERNQDETTIAAYDDTEREGKDDAGNEEGSRGDDLEPSIDDVSAEVTPEPTAPETDSASEAESGDENAIDDTGPVGEDTGNVPDDGETAPEVSAMIDLTTVQTTTEDVIIVGTVTPPLWSVEEIAAHQALWDERASGTSTTTEETTTTTAITSSTTVPSTSASSPTTSTTFSTTADTTTEPTTSTSTAAETSTEAYVFTLPSTVIPADKGHQYDPQEEKLQMLPKLNMTASGSSKGARQSGFNDPPPSDVHVDEIVSRKVVSSAGRFVAASVLTVTNVLTMAVCSLLIIM